MVDFLRNSLLLICFLTFLFGVTISEKLNFKSEHVPDDRFDKCNQGGEFHLTQRQREEQTADFNVYSGNLHKQSLYLSVPHYGNIVYLDIIQSTQVEIVLEEEKEDNELLNFELQTISPYADTGSDVYMYHTALSTADNGLHVTLYVAQQQPVSTSSYFTMFIFTAIVLVFTAVFVYNNFKHVQLKEYVSYRQDTTRLLSPASTTNTAKEEETATDTDIKRNITRKWRNYFFKTLFHGEDDGLMESLTDNVTVTEISTDNRDSNPSQLQQASNTSQSCLPRRKLNPHGNQRHSMGSITHQHLKSVPFPVIFCLCVTLTVAAVFAWRTSSFRHVLKVGIPKSAHIRKVRSYSEKPDLAGININTSSINLLTKLQLIDVDDSCKDNLTSCHTHAYCDVDSGTFNCICRRGYYVDKQTCRECATACPDGYYMSEPCTTHKNVVCKACTECGETAYEAAPCRTTHDRICLDVSFPVNHIKWKGTSPVVTNTTIDVTSSNNVFIDNLGKIRSLDTVVYITNNQQSMEFFYGRPSGLEIKIKVSEIFLVPSYVDLDHIDDTPFFLTYREPMQDLKDRYGKIQEKYCRHPLPDHYKMILEVIRNLTSAASYTACDPSNEGSPRCQDRYKKGNKYLNRYLDVKCPKTQGSFEHLKKHPNVIYCPYITTLLTKTFGLKPSELEALSFPTQQCQQLKHDCEKCIFNSSCPNSQDFSPEGDCCSIPCYSTRACSQAFSSTCPQKPVECAAGDVYMFILEPLFEMLGRQYMCHLKYRKPIQLYQVDYQVDIPNLQYSLRKKQHIVKAANKTTHQNAKFDLDFMSIEHVAFPEIHDEVVVVGNRFDRNHSAQKFTLYPLKTPSDFNKRKKFNVRPGREDIKRNVYSTHVQLERPFLYSSSVWYRGGCVNKNFSQFYPAQHIYKRKPIEIDPNIMKSDDYFEYQVTPVDGVPYIKFYISGNESILKYYKSDFQTAQINGSSLHGDLQWNHDNKTWVVSINGTLLSCPAYITTDVYDKYMVARLGHFDVFVKCPSSFQISFTLQQPRGDTPDIFIVIVNDSATSHRIVLSLIDKPVYLPVKETTSLIPISSNEYPWIPIIVTFVLTVIILTAFLLLGIYIGNKKPINRGKIVKYCETVTFINKEDDPTNIDGGPGQMSRPISRGIVCVLVTLYLVYAFMFTFSMLLGIFYMFQGSLVMNLTIVSNTSAKVQEVVQTHFKQNENFEKYQASLMLNQTTERLDACSHHIQSSIEGFLKKHQIGMQSHLNGLYGNNKTLTALVHKHLDDKNLKMKTKLDSFVEECNKTIQEHYSGVLGIYMEFLEQVSVNGWMEFPLEIFISQLDTVESKLNRESRIEFMNWLEVDKVKDVLNIKNKLLSKLTKSFSTVPLIMADKVEREITQDGQGWDLDLYNYVQLHSVLYQDTIYKDKMNAINNSYKLTTGQANSWSSSDRATLLNQMRVLFIPVFIVVFLFMDVLLLSYRFSWLRQVFTKARLGMEEKIPTDHVASKIHFTLTGNDITRSDNVLDNPYNYYVENKEGIVAGKSELYLLYCRASPRSKEDILKEIWHHKMRQKQKSNPKVDNNTLTYFVIRLLKYIYKHVISPILWRFVLVGVFVLIICLVTKATSDIVTIETATFLMDTNSILPQVHRQISITNNALSDLARELNNQLSVYKSLLDHKVSHINSFLQDTLTQQNLALQSIVMEFCMQKGDNSCSNWLFKNNLTDLIVSCGFLPLNTQLLTDFNEDTFMHFVHSELYPLVNTLRTILFNTCYILFVYSCFMLVCHVFIRLILLYLIKNKQLPKKLMYLVSNANDCWKENQSNAPKDGIYRTNSWIESCESGVVGDIDDHFRESNM